MKGKMKLAVVFMVVAALSLMAFSAMAADAGKKAASPKQLAQQEKMKACNAEAKAKALKGDERKKFMSECLKGKADAAAEAPAGSATQQDKMKACNAEAKTKGLKGDDRKKFMSDCLKAAP